METVKRFINDQHTTEDVLKEIISYLESRIIEEAYAGKDVSATAKAKQVVEQSFVDMINKYRAKQEKPYTNENV